MLKTSQILRRQNIYTLLSAVFFEAKAWQRKEALYLPPSLPFPSPVCCVSSVYSILSSGSHLSLCPSRPWPTLMSPPPSFCATLFVQSSERWQLWQRQSADAGLKNDRLCPAATQLGSQRSITLWRTRSSVEREGKEEGGGVRARGQVEGE